MGANLKLIADCFDIPVSCLTKPNDTRLLRPEDPAFVEALKVEMLQNPTILVSPIIGVPILRTGQQYDKKHPCSYKYETIGGNHTRIALQDLMISHPHNNHFKSRMVAVYVGLSDEQVLRLAGRHNRATGYTHPITTQDKVVTYYRYLIP